MLDLFGILFILPFLGRNLSSNEYLPAAQKSSPQNQSKSHSNPGRQSLSQSQSPSPRPQSPLQSLAEVYHIMKMVFKLI